jgi:hypothetical protein
MSYYQFSKKHFEYELNGILIRNKVGFMDDITDQWISEGHDTWERVYRVTTKNKSVNIIIFSSIDIRTNEVRDNGADRVRVVLQWNTKKGPVYKKIHHHNRLNTLFRNLEQTIMNIQPQVFNLNYKEFTPGEVV